MVFQKGRIPLVLFTLENFPLSGELNNYLVSLSGKPIGVSLKILYLFYCIIHGST